ncbi:MAG TPA: nucleotidyltransferase domain-containing protein [Spirochaetia bacterium]|nr:nucleotidyltransferase domain-containing protein [Spirochaetia bacterium]
MAEKNLATYLRQKYPLGYADHNSAPGTELLLRRERAWKLAREAASLLKDCYGAEKVAVFGSLAHQLWFNRWSDVDLAAWDIPPDRFYAAVGAVTGLSAEFDVDLVDVGTCRDSIRKAIEKEGVEI